MSAEPVLNITNFMATITLRLAKKSNLNLCETCYDKIDDNSEVGQVKHDGALIEIERTRDPKRDYN